MGADSKTHSWASTAYIRLQVSSYKMDEEVWLIQLDWPDMGTRKFPRGIYLVLSPDIKKITFPRIHKHEVQSNSNVLFRVKDLGLKAHGLPDEAVVLKGPVALNSVHGIEYSYSDVLWDMRDPKDTKYQVEVARVFITKIHFEIFRYKELLNNTRRHAGGTIHGLTTTTIEQALESVLQGQVSELIKSIDYVLQQHRHGFYILNGRPDWKGYVQTALSQIPLDMIFRVMKQAPPQPIPVEDIQRKFDLARRIDHRGQKAVFHLVQGVEPKQLARAPSGSTGCAVVQVASQFNFLQSTSPTIMGYLDDNTQGAQASLGSLAALMVRDHFFKGMADAEIQPLFEHLRPPQYQHGNLQLVAFESLPMSDLLEKVVREGSMLRILPQWGLPDLGGGKPMLQVFSAAPSCQDVNMTRGNIAASTICNLLVVSQYRAIAQLAVMLSLRRGGERVPLHLTLVGQGRFQNPPSVLRDSLNAVHEVVDGYNVDVFVHGSSANDIRLIKTVYPNAVNDVFLNAGQFMVYRPQQPRIQATQPSIQARRPRIQLPSLSFRGLFNAYKMMPL